MAVILQNQALQMSQEEKADKLKGFELLQLTIHTLQGMLQTTSHSTVKHNMEWYMHTLQACVHQAAHVLTSC